MKPKETTRNAKQQDIHLILKDLLKVIKVVSLYPEGNPLPESLKRTFSERLVDLAEQHGDIAVVIDKNQLTYENVEVFTDRSKEESLAGLLFDTGMSTITFKNCITVEEIYSLLDMLKLYQNDPNKETDLIAMMWEANFSGIAYQTVEDIKLASYDGDFKVQEVQFANRQTDGDEKKHEHVYSALFSASGSEESADTEPDEDSDIQRYAVLDDGTPTSGPAPSGGQSVSTITSPPSRKSHGNRPQGARSSSAAGMEHAALFDVPGFSEPSLQVDAATKAMGYDSLPKVSTSAAQQASLILNDEFKLSQEEEDQIRQLLNQDAEFDMFESTSELCKELLHQESGMTEFFESVTICEKVIDQFLAAGHLNDAVNLIRYFETLEGTVRHSKPLWAERLKEARAASASRDQMSKLATALNEGPEIPPADLRRFLDLFGMEGLLGLGELQGKLQHVQHRSVLTDVLITNGRQNIHMIAQGLFDKRVDVICQTVAVLAEIGDKSALGYLQRVVDHADRSVRIVLVDRLKESADDKALELLKQAAYDADGEIRRLAIASIVKRRGQAPFEVMVELINDARFASLTPEDQQALLNAYSTLGGDSAIDYLSGLILKFNFTRNKQQQAFREAAFTALCYNRSEKGEKQLLKLSTSWRPDIKQRAAEALKKRREILFGGTDDTSGR